MYTEELKTRIQNKLLNKQKLSTNPWIYRKFYIEKNNLTSLIEEIKTTTQFINTAFDRLDERIYCILYDITEVPKCYCNNDLKFKRFQLGYRDYCSVKCRANDIKWQEKVEKIMLEKYDVTHISKTTNEREKRRHLMNRTRLYMNYSNAAIKRKETINRLYGSHYNSGWTDKAIETRINNGTMVPIEILDEYKEYTRKVNQITKRQNLTLLENFEKRGVLGKDKDPFHVDHIVSIYDGFMNDIPVEIVGHICNLHCISARENITKGNKSWMTIEELLRKYYE